MPHLVILYTPNIEAETDMSALCRTLADTMLKQRDEAGKPVFPIGGTRVLAYPAAHYAVADGKADYAFVYLNIRMAAGRSAARAEESRRRTAGRRARAFRADLREAPHRHHAADRRKPGAGVRRQAQQPASLFNKT